MKINPSTLLFEDLTPAEIDELHRWAESVSLIGHLPVPEPAWVKEWEEVAKVVTSQRLLLLSTVLVQKVAISIVRALRPDYQP